MISLGDRQALAQDIYSVHTVGARFKLACDIAGSAGQASNSRAFGPA